MRDKGKQILGIATIIIVTSAIGTLVFSGVTKLESQDYVSNIRVPGIVEGTAQMIDTQTYFTKKAVSSAKATIDLSCNDSNYIEMAIGYKEATKSLMNVQNPVKEIEIWSEGNKFQTRSVDRSTSNNEIKAEWDLLSIGFTETEYIKADERIWYLKISDIRTGPFGYERNITIEENGELITGPEFVPNMNYIEAFQVTFNGLTFETMLHPFFDGSKEVVIPIRGVNHELTKESFETLYRNDERKGTWTTTIPSGSDNNKWAIVFGTSNYDTMLVQQYLPYPPMECRGFIQGITMSGAPSEFDAGILDYGWRVAYCMDGSSSQTDMATTTKTDDNHLEKMFEKIDDWQGSNW